VYWFRGRIFWAFVINCDLINNNNSTISKERTCTLHVLCQLEVKYSTVLVFVTECNVLTESKTMLFQTRVNTHFFVPMWGTILKSSQAFYGHPVYMRLRTIPHLSCNRKKWRRHVFNIKKRKASTCLVVPGDPSRLGTLIYVVTVGTWRMCVNVYYTYVVVSVVSRSECRTNSQCEDW